MAATTKVVTAFYPFLNGVVEIACDDGGPDPKVRLILCAAGPWDGNEGERTWLTDVVNEQLQEFAVGTRNEFDLPLALEGTSFQMRVWEALCAIPYGETRSYLEVAKMIGSPGAARAVGVANNRNPFNVVIPCHRVIGSNGRLVGYAGGVDMKRELLELERRYRDDFEVGAQPMEVPA